MPILTGLGYNMNQKEFVRFLERIRAVPSGLRRGQYAFNMLADLHPAVAAKVRNTDDDPFYDDSRMDRFFSAVAKSIEY